MRVGGAFVFCSGWAVRGSRKRFGIGVGWSAVGFTGLSLSINKTGNHYYFFLSPIFFFFMFPHASCF